MSTSDQDPFSSCFNNWSITQEEDIEKLLRGLKDYTEDDVKLKDLAENHISHYRDYCANRAILAQEDAPCFFCPVWGGPFENAHLWLAGCRPSFSIRLVYTICGSKLESHLDEYLQGDRKGDLGCISALQLGLLDELQKQTIKEEEKLSTWMASLQEKIADDPLALLAYNSNHPYETNDEVDRAMGQCSDTLANVLRKADKLRISTLEKMVKILTPVQAVDFLVATMKLHLSVHEWGKRRKFSENKM